MTATDAAAPAKPSLSIWTILLLLPVIAHCIAVASFALFEDYGALTTIDYAVLGATAVYILVLAVVLRTGRLLKPLLIGTYAALGVVFVLEIAARVAVPPVPEQVPLAPGVRESVAAEGMQGISGEITYSVNSLGVRGPEVKLDEVDLKILCVGSTFVEARYVTDRRSWPWQLQEQLASRLDRDVFVGNAGIPGTIAIQYDYLLRNYALAKKFDWVIVCCGLDDINVRLDGVHVDVVAGTEQNVLTPAKPDVPFYFYYRRSAIPRAWRALFAEDESSSPHDTGAWIAEDRIVRRQKLRENPLEDLPPDYDLMVASYREELERIIETCRELNLKPVLTTHPTRYGKDLPAEVTDTFTLFQQSGVYVPEVMEQIVAGFNGAMREVCRERDVPCIDLDGQLPKDETVFFDDLHINASGNDQVARIVADWFVRELGENGAAAESP
ncbi:MAG: SGNH/GDSL hydrolase family protein [Planctomycetaceae bacterium]